MSYTVLARRYRPERFEDVVGQEAVARTLKNAIEMDRVAHAYLFTGTRGVGKTTMARILAKALNCLAAEGPTTEPCCECESCVATAEGEDIDVIEIDGASNTGVEHIRELRQNAIYRPARARFKIYIIDEVHMLSVSAFNALLKTLEEPPEHVKFILATTEPNKVLATILSRCQRFDFRNIGTGDIADQLSKTLKGEKVKAEEALVRRVARLANGSMRDGLSLLDQLLSMSDGELTLDLLNDLLGTPGSERVLALAGAIAGGDLAAALEQMDTALNEGLALEQLAEALQGHFRDLLVLRNCGAETEMVDLPDEAARAQAVEQAGAFDDAALVYAITVMEELRRALRTGGAGRALLEAALVRLTASDRFGDTKTLLEQLQGLAASGSFAASAAPTTGTPTRAAAPARRPATAPARREAARKVAAPAANSALNAPAELTLEYLQGNWETIIGQLAPYLARVLSQGQPREWQNGELTLAYGGQAGALQMMADRPDGTAQTERGLSDVLGQPVKVRLLRVDDDTAANDGKKNGPPAANGRQSAPGARPSQKEIDAALKDPKVVAVQEILGGRVKTVERT